MLQLEYRCPGGFYGTLSSWLHVNDHKWHSILVEETDTSIRLLVDSTGNGSLVLPENCQGLRPERDLFLGGLVLSHSPLNVSQGFEGCLDAVTINGEALELLAQGRKVAGLLERQALTPCCIHRDDCRQKPCLNGGTCSQAHGKGKGWGVTQKLIPGGPSEDPDMLYHYITIEFTKYVLSPQPIREGRREESN